MMPERYAWTGSLRGILEGIIKKDTNTGSLRGIHDPDQVIRYHGGWAMTRMTETEP
jgi:hypothetical protein